MPPKPRHTCVASIAKAGRSSWRAGHAKALRMDEDSRGKTMRNHLCLAVIGLMAAVPAVRADNLDPKAIGIVKDATTLIKNAKAVHVDGTIDSTAGEGTAKRETRFENSYDFQRP